MYVYAFIYIYIYIYIDVYIDIDIYIVLGGMFVFLSTLRFCLQRVAVLVVYFSSDKLLVVCFSYQKL